jgi:hypothetical protein
VGAWGLGRRAASPRLGRCRIESQEGRSTIAGTPLNLTHHALMPGTLARERFEDWTRRPNNGYYLRGTKRLSCLILMA